MIFHTYIYSDPRTDTPFYVGKGHGDRANTHWKGTSNRERVKGRISKLREQGVEPSLEIIECKNEFAALWMERMLIAAYGRKDFGKGPLLNMTDGGDGTVNRTPRKQTAEERKKRSESAKKHWDRNPTKKQKYSEMNSGSGNPFYGKTHTEEARSRSGAAHIGFQAWKFRKKEQERVSK